MIQHHFPKKNSAGLTLVEMMIVVGIGALLIGAITLFVGRGFTVNREQFEQVRITEDARTELERISNVIRNSRDIDLNSDGTWEQSSDLWLQYAADNEFSVYSNIDSDDDTEHIRYFLEGTDFKRGVIQPQGGAYNSADEEVATLVRSLRNEEQGIPLFQYYSGPGEQVLFDPSPSLSFDQRQRVIRIGFSIIVDVQPNRYPAEAIVYSAVAPRRGQISSLEADLDITKSAPNTITHNGLNTQVTYDITVTNLGDGPASDIVVHDPIPNFLTLNVTQSDSACQQTVVANEDVVECTAATLKAGGSTEFTLVFDVSSEVDCAVTIVVNDRVVATSNEQDPDLSNNEAQDSSFVLCGPITRLEIPTTSIVQGDPARLFWGGNNVRDIPVPEVSNNLETVLDKYEVRIDTVNGSQWEAFVVGPILIWESPDGQVQISQNDTLPLQDACGGNTGQSGDIEAELAQCDEREVCATTPDGTQCVQYKPLFRYTFPADDPEPAERLKQYFIEIVTGPAYIP